jgi:subtilisin family serine protease
MQTYMSNRGIGPIPSVPGSDGRGTVYVDIEYGWQLQHEDLASPPIENIGGFNYVHSSDPESNHGTSVLGIISGNPNAYGVTGIAPRATAMVTSAVDQNGYYQPARAILQAARRLRPGDVIVIEQQAGVCGTENELGPLEYYQDIFDAVAWATAKGVIVLAAAGNGRDNQGPGVNLDSPACQGLFDRRLRDSRAIIVGAGSSVDRSKLFFSTYGSRVDVQGWGEYVTTTGYGDAYNPSNDPHRYYTNFFSGTSSATPIVAGTVLVIQGVRKACGLAPATPLEMRNLLVRTGVKQGNPRSTHIGPLPNLAAALKASVPARCLKPRSLVYSVLPDVSDGILNLRQGPATDHPIVVSIPAGSTGITLGECRHSDSGTKPWCAARWNGYSGWLSSCCIVDQNGSPPRIF